MRDFKLFVNILLAIIFVIPNFSASASKISEDISFLNADNKKINLEAFENNVILIHFWATWCAPCTTEMQVIDKLQKDYRKRPFKVLALSEDYKGIEAVKSFYKKHDIKYLDEFIDDKNAIFKDMMIPSLPFSVLIDKSGNIVETYKGAVNWNDEEIRTTIELELKEIEGEVTELPETNADGKTAG
ncbi:MAG: TlpA family protein disulfide reductase [Alphaproteobacteria bacterium]|nr:TlpA family protein disulfide reductase [Alphaproteobacteria bacterium]OJV11983.1 MAG: hypothetical protein BGO27_06420 [Alphaproteobacteria bacterium 33-17]